MTDSFEKTSVFGKNVRPINRFQKNERLRRDIYFEIRKLNTTLHTNRRDSRHAATIEKFIDAMIPSKTVTTSGKRIYIVDDPGRLPICAKRAKSPIRDKVLCVFYLVSCLIQSYWAYLKDESEDNLAVVKQGLAVQRYVNKHYNQMHVVGDVKKGFILEK